MAQPHELPIPEWFDAQAILAQLVEGKRTEDIAACLNVSRDKLVYFLRTRAPEDWKEAQVIRSVRRKEEAEDEIDAAGDMLELQKAIAKLKSAQWDLERVCRRIYGEAKEPTATPVIIQIADLRQPEPRVIEGA